MQHSGLKLDREPGFDIIGAAPTLKVACRSPGPAIKSEESRYHLPVASSLMRSTRDAIGDPLVFKWPRNAWPMQCFAFGRLWLWNLSLGAEHHLPGAGRRAVMAGTFLSRVVIRYHKAFGNRPGSIARPGSRMRGHSTPSFLRILTSRIS